MHLTCVEHGRRVVVIADVAEVRHRSDNSDCGTLLVDMDRMSKFDGRMTVGEFCVLALENSY
jgi:hypothetical protein